MKKLIISLSALTALLAVLIQAVPTRGQQGGTAAAAAPARQARPHQVGLIDMAYVFNNYEKFKALQASMQADLKAARDKAQTTIDQIRQINEQLASGTLTPDSPEYKTLEQKSIRLQTELEAYGRVTQTENLRKEAEIYKQVYLEVQDAIKVYSKYYGYTLIMRFDREQIETATNPQDILNRLTRQVVYHRGEDDLTEVILQQLNQQYQQAATAARPTGAATTTR